MLLAPVSEYKKQDITFLEIPRVNTYSPIGHWTTSRQFLLVKQLSRFDIPRRVKTRTIISVSEGTPAMAIIKSNATVTDAMTSDLSALAEAGDNPVEVQESDRDNKHVKVIINTIPTEV